MVAGQDGTTTQVHWSLDDLANGTEITDLADAGLTSFVTLHVVLDTWAVVKADGSLYRLVQDRGGDVRLADDVSDIAGARLAYASARFMAYDQWLNRYYMGGSDYVRYTDDIVQAGTFVTRALPAGGNLIGRVQISPALSTQVTAAAGNLVKTGPGRLVAFHITSVSNVAHDVYFYDNTAASGTVIYQCRVNASTTGPAPISFCPSHPIPFSTGLYVNVGHGNTRVLVVYQ
jgi:hypothetical protein